MNRPTIIFLRHGQIGSRIFPHGSELPPGILDQATIDKWLDEKWIAEAPERRSLHKIFAPFNGCKESEELTESEKEDLCL